MKTKLSILAILVLLRMANSQPVVTDTIFSNSALDGGICYMYEQDNYYIVHGTPDSGPGDGYNPFLWVWIYCKGYYTFNISSIPFDTSGFELISAIFQLYQYKSFGNDEEGVYPIWDFPGGDTNYCYLDHVNYGDMLDLSDWTAGDEGDPQTLTPLYTIVSSTPDTGFRNMDVTPLVQSDLLAGREQTQFRIHFPIGTDYDFYGDRLSFQDESPNRTRPKLIVQYLTSTTGIEHNSGHILGSFSLSQNYPNPFNPTTKINYQLPTESNVLLSVYSLQGHLISSLISSKQNAGYYTTVWNGLNNAGELVSSGMYLILINASSIEDNSTFKASQKVVLLR